MDIGIHLARCIEQLVELRKCMLNVERDCTFDAFELALKNLGKVKSKSDFKELTNCKLHLGNMLADATPVDQGDLLQSGRD